MIVSNGMMTKHDSREIVHQAWKRGVVVPGFNIPYLPMMEPVVQALRDCNRFGLIMVARLEWEKFAAESMRAVRDRYNTLRDPAHTRLHLDHVPVIDEDGQRVDYQRIIAEALDLGYDSVMVDGSRLPLDENIARSAEIVRMASAYGVPVEAELGAVMGHEAGPGLSYERILAERIGFSVPVETERFVAESGVDWLSVAVGNIHGAISDATRGLAKPLARLDLDHLQRLNAAARRPLVLHGGTGIAAPIIRQAIRGGIAKINIATAIRQPYEHALACDPARAHDAVYDAVCDLLRNTLQLDSVAAAIE